MIVQLIISGILLGSIYALLSIGLSLMLGVSNFLNFAHGDFVMVGMYMALTCYQVLHLNAYVSWPIVTLTSAAFGGVIFLVARRTIVMGHINQMLLTIGLSMIMQNTMLTLFKADYKSVPNSLSGSVKVGSVYLSSALLITFVIALLVTAIFLVFIKYTTLGRAMRAVGDDRHAGILMGIPIARIDLLTFCIGIGMAGLAGGLLMTNYPVTPTVGSSYNLIAWVIVIMGGLGFLQGALMSAFLIGICEVVSGFYLGADLRQLVYYILFVIVLVFKPEGLFSGLENRKMRKVKRA